MSKQLKTIPQFANEEEERAFWESHDSTDYLDWNTAQSVVLSNLKPTTKTISLRLPQHLLDSIKAAANSRDVPYQSLNPSASSRQLLQALPYLLHPCSRG